MDGRSFWSDVDASRRRAIDEYEHALDALERALADPPAPAAGEMKRQTERWGMLLRSIREASADLSSVVRTTDARLRDARAAGLSIEPDETLSARAVAAKNRTAVLSERLRGRAAEAASERAVRRRRRPVGPDFSRKAGTQIDIRV